MRKLIRFSVFALLLNTLLLLSACERAVSDNEKTAVLAYSEAVTDNLFAGLTANDYKAFSRDFDSEMYERVPAINFAQWKREVDHKLGNYLSRQVNQVTQSDEFFVVVYQAKFDQQGQVKVTVAFHRSGSIAFLSFDSVNYSWSAWE